MLQNIWTHRAPCCLLGRFVEVVFQFLICRAKFDGYNRAVSASKSCACQHIYVTIFFRFCFFLGGGAQKLPITLTFYNYYAKLNLNFVRYNRNHRLASFPRAGVPEDSSQYINNNLNTTGNVPVTYNTYQKHNLQQQSHLGDNNKKAQLTLTNPRDAKAYRKLLQFDVKTSCRQVNDLFKVMQQPSAPSGE